MLDITDRFPLLTGTTEDPGFLAQERLDARISSQSSEGIRGEYLEFGVIFGRVYQGADTATFFSALNYLYHTIDESDYDKFRELSDQWRKERGADVSSMAEAVACSAYLRMIALGNKMLPFIIRQLEEDGEQSYLWHPALEAITGENPVPNVEGGNDSMLVTQSWRSWYAYWTQSSSSGLALALSGDHISEQEQWGRIEQALTNTEWDFRTIDGIAKGRSTVPRTGQGLDNPP